MAWMACRNCTAKYAVGLLRCPQCGAVSELFAVPDYVAEAEEENMPKITVAGGASNALGEPDEIAEPVADVAPEPEVVAEPEPDAQPEEAAAETKATEAEASASASVEAEDAPAEVEEVKPEETLSPAPKKRAPRKPASGAGSTTGA